MIKIIKKQTYNKMQADLEKKDHAYQNLKKQIGEILLKKDSLEKENTILENSLRFAENALVDKDNKIYKFSEKIESIRDFVRNKTKGVING